MSRDEALRELGVLLKDDRLGVSRIVDAVLTRLNRDRWTEVVVLVKKASWEEFAPAAGLDPTDRATGVRYERFQSVLIRHIEDFWRRFVGQAP